MSNFPSSHATALRAAHRQEVHLSETTFHESHQATTSSKPTESNSLKHRER